MGLGNRRQKDMCFGRGWITCSKYMLVSVGLNASPKPTIIWSMMTLNYWMMVERYPNLKEEVGGLILDCEVSSLLDINLALACRPSVSKK